METVSALLTLCAGNSPVTGEFPAQRTVTRSFDIFFAFHLNKRLSKQSWGWWFETPCRPLWRHWNGLPSPLNCFIQYFITRHMQKQTLLYHQLNTILMKQTWSFIAIWHQCLLTSNGSWCIGIKGEMSGTVCVTFTWDMYIYMSCLYM